MLFIAQSYTLYPPILLTGIRQRANVITPMPHFNMILLTGLGWETGLCPHSFCCLVAEDAATLLLCQPFLRPNKAVNNGMHDKQTGLSEEVQGIKIRQKNCESDLVS